MSLGRVNLSIESWQIEAAKVAKINLSELLREAINAALNTEKDIEAIEAEIQKNRAELAAKEMMLDIKKKESITANTEEALKPIRYDWLSLNPKVIEGYKAGFISIKGWQQICINLKTRSKKQAEHVIEAYILEQSGGSQEFQGAGQ